MRNWHILIFGGILLADFGSVVAQRVIFLHHSVGDNVFFDGNVRGWINDYNDQHDKNYVVHERSYPNDPYPWDNYPYDYWNLWINGACDNDNADIECMSALTADYDVIIFKHCYPGAHVLTDGDSPSVSSTRKSLANYKLQYRALRDLMDSYPDNKFIVWTLAPLHQLNTTETEAARALEFVNWVKNDWLTEDEKEHPNIYVFDFFGLVAEQDPAAVNGKVNCLKYEFEISHIDDNNHPNEAANVYVGPIFAQFIVSVIEDREIPSPLPGIRNEKPFIALQNNILKIYQDKIDGFEKVIIYDLIGRPVSFYHLSEENGEFNISDIIPGFYVIRITGKSGFSHTIKVLKK